MISLNFHSIWKVDCLKNCDSPKLLLYFVSLLWGKYKQHSKLTKNFCYAYITTKNMKLQLTRIVWRRSTLVQLFHRNWSDFSWQIYFWQKTFHLKILKLTLIVNSLIYKASSEEKGTGQYPVRMTQKPRIGDFRQLNSKSMHGSMLADPPTSLHLQCLLGNPLALLFLSRTCAWESSNWCKSMHVWS